MRLSSSARSQPRPSKATGARPDCPLFLRAGGRAGTIGREHCDLWLRLPRRQMAPHRVTLVNVRAPRRALSPLMFAAGLLVRIFDCAQKTRFVARRDVGDAPAGGGA